MSKIPSHAQKVFTGIIYDVYQWEQEMFDGSKATFECLKRPNTVVVIPIIGNDVYYAKQEQPGKPAFLSLFGGRAENNEEPIDTAKRELLEETGLKSNRWEVLKKYSSPSKIEWDIYFFIARDCKKISGQNLDAGEKIEICKTNIDNFLNNIILDENFAEYELRNEIMSGLNLTAMESMKNIIKGKNEK